MLKAVYLRQDVVHLIESGWEMMKAETITRVWPKVRIEIVTADI